MTSNTVPGLLDAVLDPLASIQQQAQAALELAQRNKLPGPFIDTIKHATAHLAAASDALREIATILDPDRAKDQL